ncbi:MAG: glycosyltransferase [Clostridia bacterium]|nr:glycosyltransferase [Clostridia bacterium]MDE7328462.1 glycosyltransferase [Clostridia bacterium]
MTKEFSVLMTTYCGETPEFLDASLNSTLINQTVTPSQMVLVVDGPISDELNNVILKYKEMFPEVMEIVYSSENQGQSKASALGLQYIKHDILARMDSDDVCVSDRFEREYNVLQECSDIAVVGGWIAEFDTDPEVASTIRKVPEKHDDIVRMFRRRMPLNNMTVMMRKEALIQAGGYGRDTVNEDYSVYAHMWVSGVQFYNIQDVLVKARVGNDMVGRRQDMRIYRDWKKDQKYLRQNGKHSRFTAAMSNFRCFCFIITPKWVKKILYKTILRKKIKSTDK